MDPLYITTIPAPLTALSNPHTLIPSVLQPHSDNSPLYLATLTAPELHNGTLIITNTAFTQTRITRVHSQARHPSQQLFIPHSVPHIYPHSHSQLHNLSLTLRNQRAVKTRRFSRTHERRHDNAVPQPCHGIGFDHAVIPPSLPDCLQHGKHSATTKCNAVPHFSRPSFNPITCIDCKRTDRHRHLGVRAPCASLRTKQ